MDRKTILIMTLLVALMMAILMPTKGGIMAMDNMSELKGIITKGNHSYIPAHIYASQMINDPMPNEILEILGKFESMHPELEIVNWHIDYRVYYMSSIFGIWIDHRPRK